MNAPLPRLIGPEEGKKGVEAEWKFFRAMKSQWTRYPRWLKQIRWATAKEDSCGMDFLIQLDVGEIPVQIKSSPGQAHEYFKRAVHGDYDVAILVVLPTDVGAAIYSQTTIL